VVYVPTVGETPGLEGYSAGSWQGIIGPAKLSPELIMKLHNEVKRVIALPDVAERLTSPGSRPRRKRTGDGTLARLRKGQVGEGGEGERLQAGVDYVARFFASRAPSDTVVLARSSPWPSQVLM
jgi:hypothetical protein